MEIIGVYPRPLRRSDICGLAAGWRVRNPPYGFAPRIIEMIRLNYLDDANFGRLEGKHAEAGRVLTGFIASINKQIAQGRVNN